MTEDFYVHTDYEKVLQIMGYGNIENSQLDSDTEES